jgi:hypothetical protein
MVFRPALARTLIGCFRHCGSPGADIANFDPPSDEKDLIAPDLFHFCTVGMDILGVPHRFDPQSRWRVGVKPGRKAQCRYREIGLSGG